MNELLEKKEKDECINKMEEKMNELLKRKEKNESTSNMEGKKCL
ncbi:MAG: hypothetical protein QMC80_08940 [Thermoplasmatales archaeon]|nr:hypothetical protein [Thermoplasmatales archaeon]